MLAYKTCKKCKISKSLESFHIKSKSYDGREFRCKQCKSESDKQYVEENKEKVYERNRKASSKYIAQRKQYGQTTRGKEARAKALANYVKHFPEKALARRIFQNAMQSRKIVKLPCEVCGSDKAEGHHDDYSKPLDVRWLCRQHHKQFHKMLKDHERV